MLGFVIGTACLIGLVKVLRRGSCGYGACGGHGYARGCGGSGPWEGGGAWGGPFRGRGGWGGPSVFLRALLEHVDATPAQEKVIVTVLHDLREEAMKAREELRKTRADISKVMRSSNFDEVLFGELFARHDAALEATRKAAMGALGKVHETLDERQRARLADLIEHGPGFFRPFHPSWPSRGYAV